MPLKNRGHAEKLTFCKVSAILTILEAYELNRKTFLSEPVIPEIWREKNIEQLVIFSPDSQGLSFADTERGVEFMRKMIAKGLRIYVHCLAGKRPQRFCHNRLFGQILSFCS